MVFGVFALVAGIFLLFFGATLVFALESADGDVVFFTEDLVEDLALVFTSFDATAVFFFKSAFFFDPGCDLVPFEAGFLGVDLVADFFVFALTIRYWWYVYTAFASGAKQPVNMLEQLRQVKTDISDIFLILEDISSACAGQVNL